MELMSVDPIQFMEKVCARLPVLPFNMTTSCVMDLIVPAHGRILVSRGVSCESLL